MIPIDDYAYVYIKINVLSRLIMNDKEIEKIERFKDFESLGTFLKRYFPDFSPEKNSVEAFEVALWDVYFRILEKIIVASPAPIQLFLKSILLRFEIWNIKNSFYRIIVADQLKENKQTDEIVLYPRPENVLEHQNLFLSLKNVKSEKELMKFLKKTPYHHIFKEGVLKFHEHNSMFYLENALNQYYWQNLLNSLRYIPRRERLYVRDFIYYNLDFYNIDLIYRALFNSIPVSEYRHYIIPKGRILDNKTINSLTQSDSTETYLLNLKQILDSYKEYSNLITDVSNLNPDTWEDIKIEFQKHFNLRFQKEAVDDISQKALSLIFRVFLEKEKEIKLAMAQSVSIELEEAKIMV